MFEDVDHEEDVDLFVFEARGGDVFLDYGCLGIVFLLDGKHAWREVEAVFCNCFVVGLLYVVAELGEDDSGSPTDVEYSDFWRGDLGYAGVYVGNEFFYFPI